jgi:spore maturation protein B
MDLLAWGLAPVTAWLGVPAELVPLVLLRPLSGSGAYGVLGDLLRAHGSDSFVGFAASAVHGSTETTFYVLAIYFGAAGVTRTRHALYACLVADLAAMAAAVAAARLVWTGPG